MYDEKNWPVDFAKTVLIPLPKMNNAVNRSDFKTISLNCLAKKIMLRVLTKRIKGKTKLLRRQNRCGFRKGCGTRNAIGIMKTLCREVWNME